MAIKSSPHPVVGKWLPKLNCKKKKVVFFATQSRDNAPHYQHSEVGYNYQMSNICAGIGRGQMEVLDQHVVLRRQMHSFYVNLFKDIDGVSVFTTSNDEYYANY